MRISETNSIIDEGQRDWEELSSCAQTILAESSRARLNGTIETPDQGRSYHLTNAHGIGFGKEAVDGVNYKVGGKVYVLTNDDCVYSYSEERFSFTTVQTKDPTIVEAVKGQRDENEAIRKVREERVETLSGEDATLQEIYRRHLDFTKGYVQSIVRPEGTFFPVGENDWFTFYLGQVDGKKKLYVVSKEPSDDSGKLIDVEEFGYTGDQEELDEYPSRRVERSEDKAARSYCTTGSIWFSEDDTSGNLYRVNREEYVVAGNGSVYQKDDHEKAVTDPAVLLSIKAQLKEDEEIRAARGVLATKESHGDPLLLMILSWHMEFSSGVIDSEPTEKNGIKFYQVGRNASHMFYLGVKDGKMYQYATDGGYWDEEKELFVEDDASPYQVDPNNIGYVGHF